MASQTSLERRRQLGWASKHRGAAFEGMMFSFSACDGLGVVQIPDGCKQISSSKIIRVKSPFDFILSGPEGLALIDTKHTSKGSLARSEIPEHQARAMFVLTKCRKAASGFVVWFTAPDKVEFFPATDLLTKRSLRVGDGLYLGNSKRFHPKFILWTLVNTPNP